MDYLQRSGKVLRQVKVGYRAFIIRSVESDLLAPPLISLFDLDNLWVKRRLVVAIIAEPVSKITFARRRVHRNFFFNLDAHRALIARRVRKVERATEAHFV